LSLSPAKILVILVIALIVLGPDKLPKVARQAGAAWHDLRRLRGKLESDMRGAFPDLPSPQQVAQAVRSPIAYLDGLADQHAAGLREAVAGVSPGADGAGAAPSAGDGPSPPGAGAVAANGHGTATNGHGSTSRAGDGPATAPEAGPGDLALDDPSMN